MSGTKSNKLWNNIIQGSIVGLLLATLLFSITNYIKEPKDRDRCHSMLNEGKWQTDDYKQWEASGCMLQSYGKKEMGTCLSNSRIIFIGDSIIREQYYAMGRIWGIPVPAFTAIHNDQQAYVKQKNITLDMWWDPFLNTTRTVQLLEGKLENNEQRPTVVVIGCGIWYMRRDGNSYFEHWKKAIDKVLDGVSHHDITDSLILAPVEIVDHTKTNKVRQKLLTIDKITLMNNYLHQREATLGKTVTSFGIAHAYNQMVTTVNNQTLDGLHYGPPVTGAQAQITLNFRCNNDPLVKTTHYPYDTTCCYTYPSPAWYQTSLIVSIFIFVPLCILISYTIPSLSSLVPFTFETQSAFFIFGLGLLYMYVGDRTQLFGKMDKLFDSFTFTVLSLTMLVLGIVTLDLKSNTTGFLNRDQTDEWKGWMQLVILIYHFVGASRTPGIYNPVRVLVAAYLFQTGYGHFHFFYKKADFGIARVLNILVRLNLLTGVLCYLMKTDYLFYYFSPLVTFWFAVIWTTMRIMSSYNTVASFVVLKIVLMSLVTAAIIHVPGILETCFSVLSTLFKVHWDVQDWRFRLGLDAWIVYIGMLCALVSIQYRDISRAVRWVAVGLSVVGLAGYFYFELTQTKASYTQYHPYISWIPIVSFVVLRNASAWGRSVHSRFFAFIGKFSLETYIGQFHMWLAADTRGLLVVVPNTTWVLHSTVGWYVNLVLSTVIFFFVCHQLSYTTGVLTKWICGQPSPQQQQQQQKEYDAVPLLPTQVEKNQPQTTQLQVESDDDEEEQLETKPTWYQCIYYNQWIRSFACLILLGIFNRFCN